ncbi:unnamed protein product [Spirodela intermedia]|uniref:PB1 domain-containing protein n=1 Tax=Spirodela intermedia TaxID=51605 RepID=A0A7I8J5U0_SPIIN|nr:unnamed protein product [Spirodela intermedia]CAA6665414.1 unnamed protein product [Spirodela intermedia]
MEAAPSAATAAAAVSCYADSVDSMSPRSRGGDLWDDPVAASAAPAAAASKLRLMCSFGGHIVPRPHDKALCYLGGETRIVVVDRHATLADLHGRLSRSLLGGRPFSLKYQLPSEDLDSLISVTADDDLDNMIEEYDRIAASAGAGKPSAFVSSSSPPSRPAFPPATPPLTPSAPSSTTPSRRPGSSTPSTAPCSAATSPLATPPPPLPSTVCSALTTPTPPQRRRLASPFVRIGFVRAVGFQPEGGIGAGPDGNFSNDLKLPPPPPPPPRAQQQQQSVGDVFNLHCGQYYPTPPQPQLISPSSLTATSAAGSAPSNISPGETSVLGRDLSSDDDKSDNGGARRFPTPQPKDQQQQSQQQKSNLLDVPISGDSYSRPIYYQDRPPPASDPKQEVAIADYRQPVHVTDQGYLMQPLPPPLQAVDQLQQQQQQQQQQYQQQQFVQAHPHLAPLSSYYQFPIHPQQQLPQAAAHPYNPQVPMYFLPVRQDPGYNLNGDPSSGKPTIPMPTAVLPSRVAPPKSDSAAGNAFRGGASAGSQPPQPTQLLHLPDQHRQFVGYHPLHPHPSPPPSAAAGYNYEFSDSVHPQHIYYAISSGAAMAESPPAMQLQAEAKQTRGS